MTCTTRTEGNPRRPRRSPKASACCSPWAALWPTAAAQAGVGGGNALGLQDGGERGAGGSAPRPSGRHCCSRRRSWPVPAIHLAGEPRGAPAPWLSSAFATVPTAAPAPPSDPRPGLRVSAIPFKRSPRMQPPCQTVTSEPGNLHRGSTAPKLELVHTYSAIWTAPTSGGRLHAMQQGFV